MSTLAFLEMGPDETGGSVHNEKLRNRLTNHLQQMIQAHLLHQ
jgi:hypothetical protein